MQRFFPLPPMMLGCLYICGPFPLLLLFAVMHAIGGMQPTNRQTDYSHVCLQWWWFWQLKHRLNSASKQKIGTHYVVSRQTNIKCRKMCVCVCVEEKTAAKSNLIWNLICLVIKLTTTVVFFNWNAKFKKMKILNWNKNCTSWKNVTI